MTYTYVGHRSPFKQQGRLPLAMVWVSLDAMRLCEISQSQKEKLNTHTRNLQQPNSRKQRAERGVPGLREGTWGAAAQWKDSVRQHEGVWRSAAQL